MNEDINNLIAKYIDELEDYKLQYKDMLYEELSKLNYDKAIIHELGVTLVDKNIRACELMIKKLADIEQFTIDKNKPTKTLTLYLSKDTDFSDNIKIEEVEIQEASK